MDVDVLMPLRIGVMLWDIGGSCQIIDASSTVEERGALPYVPSEDIRDVAISSLDALGALGVAAVTARVTDDEHGAALAAAWLVGRHCGGWEGGSYLLVKVT
jgi:hypothetical protein